MTGTLRANLRNVWATDWKHRRSGRCLMSQAEIAIESLLAYYPVGADPVASEVTPARLQVVVATWYQEGRSPATITKRLNCLSKLGVTVAGCKPPKAKVLQWWLNPEMEARLCKALHDDGIPSLRPLASHAMACYIAWATSTGLRVEETLRLTWDKIFVSGGRFYVTVPGTKTATAQATLPLSSKAADALRLLARHATGSRDVKPDHGPVIGFSYDDLERMWGHCRTFLGVQDVPTATLKALRRTAARHLHIDCKMPLDMVREYLRHENIETTQGYLKLVGGYSAGEMEKFL